MIKLWPYIAIFAFGIIGGFILHWYIVRNRISSTTIKGKIKQKRNSDSSLDVKNIISDSTPKPNRKLNREAKKAARKLKNQKL